MKKLLVLISLMLFCVSASANEGVINSLVKSLRLDSGYYEYDITQNNSLYNIIFYYDGYSCSITSDSEGVALSYSKSYAASDKKHLPAISKNDAKGNATVFVNTAAGDIMNEIDLSTAEVTYNNGNFQVVFYRKTKGIIYEGNYLSVGVDGDSGEIISYARFFDKGIKFADFDTVMSHKDIVARFKSLKGLELRYNKKIDGDSVIAYPVYSVNPLIYYNAVNGNVTEAAQTITYKNYFDVTSMYEKANDSSASGVGVISVSEALKTVRSMEELGITDDYEIVRARYLKNANSKFLIVLDFVKDTLQISVTVDAHTGVVCEFNGVPLLTGGKTDAEIKETVLNYTDKYMSSYMKEMRISSVHYGEISVFLFERTVSGIPFKSNGLCIAADKSGHITNISFLWDDIEFPETKGIISLDRAYEIFEEKCEFELRYYLKGDEYIPIYALNSLTTGIIDAVSGNMLTYDGKVMQPKKYLAYIDLNSHYSKERVEKMADCDIYVSRGNVALAEPIIQKDYLLLISAYLPDGKPIIENFGDLTEGQLEMLYNAFVSEGVITEEEINYEGYVTREKAVEYFIKTIGYGDVAMANEIFKNHFADSSVIDESLRGCVELARAMGIISGNGVSFMPKDYLSNGDSLIMVYNYLSGR